MPKAKAKKRKTSSTSRKAVSRKPVAVQKKVVKKDKSKIAWQIVLGIAAALLFLFIIAKFSASVTGNVPAVGSSDSATQDFSLFDNLGEAVGTQESEDETDVSLKDEIENKEFLDAFDFFLSKSNQITNEIITPILPAFSSVFGSTQEKFFFPKIIIILSVFLALWIVSGKIDDLESNFFLRFFLIFILGILLTRWVVKDDLLQIVWIPFNALGGTASFLWYSFRLFILLTFIIYLTLFVIKGKQNEIWRIFIWLGAIIFLIFAWIKGISVTASGSSKQYLFVYPISIAILFILIIINPMIQKKMADSKRKLIRQTREKVKAIDTLLTMKQNQARMGRKPTHEEKKVEGILTDVGVTGDTHRDDSNVGSGE